MSEDWDYVTFPQTAYALRVKRGREEAVEEGWLRADSAIGWPAKLFRTYPQARNAARQWAKGKKGILSIEIRQVAFLHRIPLEELELEKGELKRTKQEAFFIEEL